MKNYVLQFMSALLSSFLIMSQLHAADWSLSYGANDMIVQGARPLEEAPNGSTSHTPGFQVAIYGESNAESAIKQRGYFKVFVDWDIDELDPDHIPIWFMSNYEAKVELMSFSQNSSLSLVMDVDSKVNSVSAVEWAVKALGGIRADYTAEAFTVGLKTAAGYYGLEIDDDIPRTRGYERDTLGRTENAYSVMADTRFALGDVFTLSLLAQTWQTGDQWLENQYQLQLDYDSDSWVKGSTFVVSILQTEYNLEGFNREDTTVPDYLPILPWNKDTLIQAYIVIPWKF